MKSLHGAYLLYDHVFSWVAIIVACIIVINVCYTIYVQIGSTMTMSIKV